MSVRALSAGAIRKLEIEADLRENPNDERYKFFTPSKASSSVWNHFQIVRCNGVTENLARCTICKDILQYSAKKGTGSLLRHKCSTGPGRKRGKKCAKTLLLKTKQRLLLKQQQQQHNPLQELNIEKNAILKDEADLFVEVLDPFVHAEGTMSAKKINPIWDFFRRNESTATCKLCSKDLSLGSLAPKLQTTTNIKNHLQNRHIQAWEVYKETKKEMSENKEKPRRTIKKTNPIWNFFIRKESTATCNLCTKDLSLGSSLPKLQTLASLRKHLEKLHVKAFANYTEAKKESEATTTEQIQVELQKVTECNEAIEHYKDKLHMPVDPYNQQQQQDLWADCYSNNNDDLTKATKADSHLQLDNLRVDSVDKSSSLPIYTKAKRKNPVWDYFNRKESTATCKLCSKNLSLGSAVPKYQTMTSIQKHLQKQHFQSWELYMESKQKLAYKNKRRKLEPKPTAENISFPEALPVAFENVCSWPEENLYSVGPDPLPVITQADSDRQLFSLLCEIDKYNYLYIFERCKACNVNARQLKYLEREHLRELVPKVNLGVQAEFEFLFKEWKVKNGYLISCDPFIATTELTTPANGRSSNNTPTQAKAPNTPAQHASQPAQHASQPVGDYEVPMTYNDEEDSQASFSLSESHDSTNGNFDGTKSDKQYLLTQIIPTVLKKCQQKYKTNRNLLTEVERRMLSAAIVNYFLNRNIHLNSSTIDNLAEQISTHFPTESKRTWYDRRNNKSQGRLYTKLYNSQRRKEKSKSRKKHRSKPSSSSHTLPVLDDENASMDEEPNEEMNQIQKWLKSNKCEDIDEVISMWRTSLNYRQSQLRNISKSQDGFTEMINNWPAYTWPSGHYLLNIDFNHMYPNSETALHERWSIFMHKIPILFEAELKDNENVELFKQFKLAADVLNPDSKEAILLKLLHAITKPSHCFNTLEGVRRHSIVESQSSVMKLITSVCDLDSVAEPHPCIYLVGESILSVERCVVAFRDIQYELSLADALCACFQFYIVFQLEFPPASLNFWTFIRGYFFDIYSGSESSYAVMDNIVKFLETYEI